MMGDGSLPIWKRDLDLLFVLVSRDFVSNIPFDFNKVFQDSMRMLKNPCIHLKGDAFSLAVDYMSLTRSLMRSRHSNKREIIGSLLTSFLYIVTDLWSTRKEEELLVDTKGNTRLSQLFERFIALVTEHHCEERTVAFYADKLCLTPKYLSRLVREASGRSAPDWIDAFVILEAKNLLKYSDKSIKENCLCPQFPQPVCLLQILQGPHRPHPQPVPEGIVFVRKPCIYLVK